MSATILIIDDSSDVRAIMCEALTLDGFQALEAADGREGVRLFREARPDLVLLDMIMPEKDGLETLKEIRAIDPAAIVFAFSGGRDSPINTRVAVLLGARRGFPKPFGVEDLLAAIRQELQDGGAARKP
jgi:DNA-binding response OmpR family regulator